MKHMVLFFLIASGILKAQTLSEELVTKAHISSVNTLLVFMSQEGLNSGTYAFDKIGVDMDLYNLPFTYHFKSLSPSLNFFVVGNVGYSRVYISEDIVIPPSSRLNYENHLRTYIGGIGGGVRYNVAEDVHILGGFELLYSRSGISVTQPDDDLGDAIEDFFRQNYNDNLSYKFFANVEYKPTISGYKPYVFLGYKFYDTKSSFTFDELLSLRSSSDVITFASGFETPALYRDGKNYITGEGYAKVNLLHGVVSDVVKFETFTTVGAVAYYYTPISPWWASRFFLELSEVDASGLRGYNLGIGFTLKY